MATCWSAWAAFLPLAFFFAPLVSCPVAASAARQTRPAIAIRSVFMGTSSFVQGYSHTSPSLARLRLAALRLPQRKACAIATPFAATRQVVSAEPPGSATFRGSDVWADGIIVDFSPGAR